MSNCLVWSRWDDEKPTDEFAVYWWRVPAKEYGGIVCQPRWAEKMDSRWTINDEKKFFPPYTSWDGYRNIPLKGIEWSIANPDDEKIVVWDGLEVSDCPFCGKITKISSHTKALYGGVVCNQPPSNANCWRFECSGCGIPTLRGRDLFKMVKFWNARSAVEQKS